MKSTKIEVSAQVAQFLRELAPEPRRQVRAGLRELARDRGDILELEHPLSGFHRLRVGRYRVVFHYVARGRTRIIRCDFIERRELVYELFADLVEGR